MLVSKEQSFPSNNAMGVPESHVDFDSARVAADVVATDILVNVSLNNIVLRSCWFHIHSTLYLWHGSGSFDLYIHTSTNEAVRLAACNVIAERDTAAIETKKHFQLFQPDFAETPSRCGFTLEVVKIIHGV